MHALTDIVPPMTRSDEWVHNRRDLTPFQQRNLWELEDQFGDVFLTTPG